MTAKEQLVRLFRIQELALAIREAEAVVEAAPGKIEEIEARFRERNAEYVALKERHDELDRDRKARSHELTDLEQHRAKFTEDLMQVKNQREYAAILKEIDAVKAQIADHEDAILRDMEEIEKLQGELEEHEDHIQQEREAVEAERTRVQNESAAAHEVIESRGAERDSVQRTLPVEHQQAIERLEPRRQGIFLTKAENGTCQSCYVRIRPQVFQEIKLASVVHTCDSCRRFLYHEDSLKPESGEQTAEPASDAAAGGGTTPGPGVEAMNGGAV